VDAPETQYPFEVTAGRAKMFKHCRYAKMHLWGLVAYDKVVYLDADTMVVRNIDHLFSLELPLGPVLTGGSTYSGSMRGLYAVHDQFADIFNSGVMILAPSEATIDAMLAVYMTTKSYNIGDQGFLNVFWKNNVKFLSGEYNYLTWLATTTWGSTIFADRAVMHYTAEVKPWNFLDWHSKEETFYGKTYLARIWNEWSVQGDAVATDHSLTTAGYPFAPRNHVCSDEKTINHFSRRSFKSKNKQLSIVVVATNPAQAQSAGMLSTAEYVAKVASPQIVRSVVVLWAHNDEPPHLPKTIGKTKIFVLKRKSPNARFFPHRFETSHVLVLDQRIQMDVASIESMLTLAQDIPGRMLGPIVGSITEAETFAYSEAPGKSSYTLVDTRAAIFRTDYLYLYTCILDTRLQAIVEEAGGCEDVLMNILGSSVAEFPPGHVSTNLALENLEMGVKQSKCIGKFKLFLQNPGLNLREAFGSMIPFKTANQVKS
jgi:glycogenin glucosyltransferase